MVQRDLDIHERGVLAQLRRHLLAEARQLQLERRQVLGVPGALRLQLALQLPATVLLIVESFRPSAYLSIYE